MNSLILGLLAETSIHPGAGQSSDIIDLPVAREAATGYPVLPGSSVKGALLALAREPNRIPDEDRKRIFGQHENAGTLLVSDARLLLLPVRSLHSAYKWVTCPHLLERFARDTRRAGGSVEFSDCQVSEGEYLGEGRADLFLEERQFRSGGGLPEGLVTALSKLIAHASTRKRLETQVVVLHDNDFAWFARHGLPVQARNCLEERKKTSCNLWYEESLPPDTLLYLLLTDRDQLALPKIKQMFSDHPYLQAGGNETVGMGWFAVKAGGDV